MMKAHQSIVVVAAHPDDETLGCGGTLAKHVDLGDEVELIFMADGVRSRRSIDQKVLLQRNQAAEAAGRILGVKAIHYLRLDDNKLDSYPLLDIIQPLERLLSQIRPTLVYTHHCGDLNIDHRLTHQAVMTACRPVPGQSVRHIASFEVLSSTEWLTGNNTSFRPNLFVDISPYLETKMQALQCYHEEMRDFPHTRSYANVRHLAALRGSAVGVDAAEAFSLERSVT